MVAAPRALRQPKEAIVSSSKKASSPRKSGKRASISSKRRASATGPRQDSKQAKLIAMLRSPEGATIEQIARAFDWQPHTVRGVLSGALKKKLGLTIKSEKNEDKERVYRLG